ncbi:MAG: HAD family hydrolase [Archaeoglobaceae archaeon]
MFESDREGLEEVKGIIFDCYQTLIDIETDEDDLYTNEVVSKWLRYQGVKIGPQELRKEYKNKAKKRMDASHEKYSEIKVEDVFAEICDEYSLWPIDEEKAAIDAARVFRSASIRRFDVFPQSVKLLEMSKDLSLCVVSNAQRVFSELELKYLSLYHYFDFVLFSSDYGFKKPDERLFLTALKRLKLEPGNILAIGDTEENDLIPPLELGMKTMHINEAWKLVADKE